ncbi:unnamed protein product [Soboliphyme baturini]|uniref:Uncharacterized protein n=1 Tax=Soboliphyme baturini TaxID=241478 RepID=A0A183IEI9_9BILA|nr:unnamed protein product [Soboliphyme baturini]
MMKHQFFDPLGGMALGKRYGSGSHESEDKRRYFDPLGGMALGRRDYQAQNFEVDDKRRYFDPLGGMALGKRRYFDSLGGTVIGKRSGGLAGRMYGWPTGRKSLLGTGNGMLFLLPQRYQEVKK